MNIHFNPAMIWGEQKVPGFWPIPIYIHNYHQVCFQYQSKMKILPIFLILIPSEHFSFDETCWLPPPDRWWSCSRRRTCQENWGSGWPFFLLLESGENQHGTPWESEQILLNFMTFSDFPADFHDFFSAYSFVWYGQGSASLVAFQADDFCGTPKDEISDFEGYFPHVCCLIRIVIYHFGSEVRKLVMAQTCSSSVIFYQIVIIFSEEDQSVFLLPYHFFRIKHLSPRYFYPDFHPDFWVSKPF